MQVIEKRDDPLLKKGTKMSDIYKITITKKSKETFTGLMNRSQPEIINGFVALANDKGEWRYFSPDSIEDFLFEPVTEMPDEPTEDKTE